MGKYDVIDETLAKFFQTSPIKGKDIERIAVVMAYIEYHLIDPNQWNWELKEGSITYQSNVDKHRVIKIFIDYGKKLLNGIGFNKFTSHLENTESPVVIGVDLTKEDPYTRNCLREHFLDDYSHYLDPRSFVGYKYYLQPKHIDQYLHIYDVIFLGEGRCDDIPEEKISELQKALKQKFDDDPLNTEIGF